MGGAGSVQRSFTSERLQVSEQCDSIPYVERQSVAMAYGGALRIEERLDAIHGAAGEERASIADGAQRRYSVDAGAAFAAVAHAAIGADDVERHRRPARRFASMTARTLAREHRRTRSLRKRSGGRERMEVHRQRGDQLPWRPHRFAYVRDEKCLNRCGCGPRLAFGVGSD